MTVVHHFTEKKQVIIPLRKCWPVHIRKVAVASHLRGAIGMVKYIKDCTEKEAHRKPTTGP